MDKAGLLIFKLVLNYGKQGPWNLSTRFQENADVCATWPPKELVITLEPHLANSPLCIYASSRNYGLPTRTVELRSNGVQCDKQTMNE